MFLIARVLAEGVVEHTGLGHGEEEEDRILDGEMTAFLTWNS